ncbi:MAG: histidine kinase [Clostridia bacterium]|nr:histidine kinase [Clostridia bacterium]
MPGEPGVTGLEAYLRGNYVETLALFPAVTMLMLLAFVVHNDQYIRPDQKRTMRWVILAVFSLIVQNLLEYHLAEGEVKWLGRTLTSIYGYSIRPVILILFMRIVEPRKRFGAAWALAGVNAAVSLTALFSRICFWIGEDNHYHGGPLSDMCLTVSVILLFWLFGLSVHMFAPNRRKEAWVPVLALVLIVFAILMDDNVGGMAQPVSYLTISVTICSVAYYIWLHLQFVREHEQALHAEQRIQIMMTQIQPHFLFNTIATIRALCRRDADKAGEVAEKFGDYLRQNLDSLNIVGLIPFKKELEHTKIYAEIEMVRFENIRVEWDIQDDRFNLPPLTLQPLVENAIRHGVRIREEGIVRVSSHARDGAHEIEVWDNGKGFDVSRIRESDGSHIGLRNVEERIRTMCGGKLKIESTIGEGTRVTMTIPGREEKET